MNVLAIGAHPDDIEFGCGGTLLKYAQKGDKVYLLIITKGGMGGDIPLRKAEQEASAKILRCTEVFWGNYDDTRVPVDQKLIQTIEDVIRKVDPTFIFVHHSDDTHQDHRHLATCTVTATRYTRNVLFYEGPTTQNFHPTVFTDIDSVLDKKIASLEAHSSQVVKTRIEGLSIVDITRSAAHFRGIQGRVKNAEAFVPLRLFINLDPQPA
jgi:LmbE family N-acetylglucosaminyl deacetylase